MPSRREVIPGTFSKIHLTFSAPCAVAVANRLTFRDERNPHPRSSRLPTHPPTRDLAPHTTNHEGHIPRHEPSIIFDSTPLTYCHGSCYGCVNIINFIRSLLQLGARCVPTSVPESFAIPSNVATSSVADQSSAPSLQHPHASLQIRDPSPLRLSWRLAFRPPPAFM